jgi:hypothetical protein
MSFNPKQVRPGLRQLGDSISRLEGWWFDLTHHVSTAGAVQLEGLRLAGEVKQGFMYLPTRPVSVRLALQDLPIQEHQNYTLWIWDPGRAGCFFWPLNIPFRE